MTKRNLLTNLAFLASLMIIVILIAPVFIPSAKFLPGVGEVPGQWVNEILPVTDINLIVYLSIVYVIATLYLTKILLKLSSIKKGEFNKTLMLKEKDSKLIAISNASTIFVVLLFLISMASIPFATAHFRQEMLFADGEDLNIISNPAINNTIYHLILIPVYVAILPLTYTVGLGIYFEVMKRKTEAQKARKEK